LHWQDPAGAVVENRKVGTEPLADRLKVGGCPADSKCYRNIAVPVVENRKANTVGGRKFATVLSRLMRDRRERRTVEMNVVCDRFESLRDGSLPLLKGGGLSVLAQAKDALAKAKIIASAIFWRLRKEGSRRSR
jgi:hypothetical protein